MSSKTKTLKVLAELSVILETGETKTHPIRFIFDESPTKTCADLQAYVLSRYASKYGPLRVTDIEVLDTDFATPVYVVADDELVLEDGKRFRIRAAPIGKENRPSTGNASKDHPRAAKPVASAKTASPPTPTTFQCSVCFENFAIRDGVGCQGVQGRSGSPACNFTQTLVLFESDLAKAKDNQLFCEECVRGYVTANVIEQTLPADLNGVPCMSDGCELAINIATLRKFVPPEILNLLEERCRTEMMQKFASFEECKTEFCVAVVEFSQSPQQTQYFHCPACTAAFCR